MNRYLRTLSAADRVIAVKTGTSGLYERVYRGVERLVTTRTRPALHASVNRYRLVGI